MGEWGVTSMEVGATEFIHLLKADYPASNLAKFILMSCIFSGLFHRSYSLDPSARKFGDVSYLGNSELIKIDLMQFMEDSAHTFHDEGYPADDWIPSSIRSVFI